MIDFIQEKNGFKQELVNLPVAHGFPTSIGLDGGTIAYHVDVKIHNLQRK